MDQQRAPMSTLYNPALPFPIQPEMRTALCLPCSLLPGSSSTRPTNHKALCHRICTMSACLRMETTSCAVLEKEGRSTGRQRGSGRITGLLHNHRHHRLSWLIRPDCLHFSSPRAWSSCLHVSLEMGPRPCRRCCIIIHT